MSLASTRWLDRSDIRVADTWRLLEWCAEHGGAEFTICLMTLQDAPSPNIAAVEAALEPFERTSATRELLTVLMGQPQAQTTRLWSLEPKSIAVLQRFLSDGLFDYPSAEWDAGWLEDLIVYRNGSIMLGIISHEGEGLLDLSSGEHQEVAALGIHTFPSSRYHRSQ